MVMLLPNSLLSFKISCDQVNDDIRFCVVGSRTVRSISEETILKGYVSTEIKEINNDKSSRKKSVFMVLITLSNNTFVKYI